MTHECWNKKILWVDLTTETISIEHLEETVYTNFIGGKGLGAYLLYKYLSKGVEPLSPENIFILLSGPLQGLPAPSVGRWSIVTKSPLTGIFLDSHCGGPTGRDIKKAGYDAVCLKGRADSPKILIIDNDIISFEDASEYWGKGVYETTDLLHKKYGKDFSVYTIGPGGENQSLIATACCEVAHQTGRGGGGAVLGSKNLKAVVVRGTNKIHAHNVDAIREVNKEFNTKWQNLDIDFKKYGSRHLVEIANEVGQYPAFNFKNGYFDEFRRLDHVEMDEKFGVKGQHSCPHCVMHCTHAFKTNDPRDPSLEIESMVEYETLGLLGGNIGISDPEAVLKLNYLCDDLGLDTISAGGVIGFAMEAFERGILSEDEIGFSLPFGDTTGAMRLLSMLATKEGIGEILSNGVKKSSQEIGKGSESFAVHVKGLEIPAWDPRGRLGQGLLYATGDIGASHLRGWPAKAVPPDTSVVPIVESLLHGRFEKTIKDCLEVCHFTNRIPLTMDQMVRMVNGATGLDYTQERMTEIGRRIETLTRMFNVREGMTQADDTIPPRLWEPQTHGPREGMRSFMNEEDLQAGLQEYYELLGWHADGIPTNETIKHLGLENLCDN
ncbi:MAG: aldehyde ferredoxin oxidoreductase family protein [Candidatus Thorarchaeota archaeon]|nr:aldehyde ferredoxin oxidoreductase family protein [Candidatus Thorarchaeota archaeon]